MARGRGNPVEVEITGADRSGPAFESARKRIKLVGETASASGSRFGMAARQIAFAGEQAARTGTLAGEASKQMLAQGAEMAFLFGTGGPIIGAVAVVTLAVVELFARARKEMEETRKQFLDELEKIAAGGDIVAATQAQGRIYSGNQFAIRKPGESDAEYLQRRRGLAGLAQRKSAIDARLAALQAEGERALTDPTLRSPRAIAQRTTEMNRLRDELKAIVPLLAQAREQYAEITPVVDQLMRKESERAQRVLKGLQEEAAAKRQKISDEQAAKQAAELAKLKNERGYGTTAALRPLVGTTPTGPAIAPVPTAGITAAALPAPEQLSAFQTEFSGAFDAALASAQALNQELESTGALLGHIAGDVLANFGAAFGDAIGNAIAANKNLAGAIGDAVRNVALNEGKLYAGKALGALGDALLFGHPGALAAAGRYAAASAVLLGVARGMGGGGSGYGGAGGGGYAGGFNAAANDVAGKGKVTVVLNGKKTVLDHTDPEDLAGLKKMIETVAGTREVEFVFAGEG